MTAHVALPKDHPIMIAWEQFKQSEAYQNSERWAAHDNHRAGSMWRMFLEGYRQATVNAASLHECVNPASDDERSAQAPGAGAMGAVVEYRDLIRKQITY